MKPKIHHLQSKIATDGHRGKRQALDMPGIKVRLDGENVEIPVFYRNIRPITKANRHADWL